MDALGLILKDQVGPAEDQQAEIPLSCQGKFTIDPDGILDGLRLQEDQERDVCQLLSELVFGFSPGSFVKMSR